MFGFGQEEHGLPECLPVGYSPEADAIPVSSLREHGVAPPCLDGVDADLTIQRVLEAML